MKNGDGGFKKGNIRDLNLKHIYMMICRYMYIMINDIRRVI